MNPINDNNPTTIINVQPAKPGMYVTKMGAGIFGGLCFVAGGLAVTYVPVATNWLLTKTGLRQKVSEASAVIHGAAATATQRIKSIVKRTPVIQVHEKPALTPDQQAAVDLAAEEAAIEAEELLRQTVGQAHA